MLEACAFLVRRQSICGVPIVSAVKRCQTFVASASTKDLCCIQGDLRREGLLDRKGLKQWSFADDKMSVPVMTCAAPPRRVPLLRSTHRNACAALRYAGMFYALCDLLARNSLVLVSDALKLL